MKKIFEKAIFIYKKYKGVINYLIIGGLTTLINLVSYAIFRSFLNYIPSTILAWITAVIFAYITNKIFVFESKGKNIMIEISKFFGCRLATLGLEVLFMYCSVDLLKINDMIAKIIIQIVVIILNYVLSKLVVFRKNLKK